MLKKIKGVIKHYDWGGTDFLPQLLGIYNSDGPYAEYWLGTHPDGDATLIEENISLSHYLKFTLPFLMKVLDVRNMLSIQVHPDKRTAELGFSREEKLGTSRSAFDRVFKDPNHKPELMVALSDFWLLQGFKSARNIRETLQRNPELRPIEDYFDKHGLKETFKHLMIMPQEDVNALLKPLGQRIKPQYERGELPKDDINFWSARAYFTFNKKGVCDRGIFSLYFMNLIKLSKGDGIFQAPGVLHAYLEGQNVECMAASDNVVRGGLTSKYIDTKQLLKIVKFKEDPPQIIKPNASGIYEIPVSEFELQRVVHEGTFRVQENTIVLCLGEAVTLLSSGERFHLGPGEAALVERQTRLTLEQEGEGIFLFIAQSKIGV